MSDTGDFNARTIAEFRANHGRLGGSFEGAPVLLLHSTGARTGAERVSPMMYLDDDGRYLVFASAAGADRNPAWYHNLLAHPAAAIEIGDDFLEVRASELAEPERRQKYDEQARRYPGFAGYQAKTSRSIPVLALSPTGTRAR